MLFNRYMFTISVVSLEPEGIMLSFIPYLPCRFQSAAFFREAARRSIPHCSKHIRASAPPAAANILLKEVASQNNLESSQVESFLRLSQLLVDENKKYNLTAIRKPNDIIRKHVIDAITLLPTLENESPSTVIDVGTGAGFPGIVLAIARPDLQFTLLDSVRKKTNFHDLVIKELNLRNVHSVWARAEDAAQNNDFREQFCVATARSVAELRVLAELTLPFARIGGCVIAQKSVDEDQTEISSAANSLKICGGFVESIEFSPPDRLSQIERDKNIEDEGQRRRAIVVIRKSSPTPRKYPRKRGVPKKSPL